MARWYFLGFPQSSSKTSGKYHGGILGRAYLERTSYLHEKEILFRTSSLAMRIRPPPLRHSAKSKKSVTQSTLRSSAYLMISSLMSKLAFIAQMMTSAVLSVWSRLRRRRPNLTQSSPSFSASWVSILASPSAKNSCNFRNLTKNSYALNGDGRESVGHRSIKNAIMTFI